MHKRLKSRRLRNAMLQIKAGKAAEAAGQDTDRERRSGEVRADSSPGTKRSGAYRRAASAFAVCREYAVGRPTLGRQPERGPAEDRGATHCNGYRRTVRRRTGETSRGGINGRGSTRVPPSRDWKRPARRCLPTATSSTADKDGLREWDESGTRATPKWTGDASKVIFCPVDVGPRSISMK